MTQQKSNLLITGASGYLGGRIVQLSNEIWHVTGTYFSHSPQDGACQWRHLDLRDEHAVQALVINVHPDVIIHTAASTPGSGTDFYPTNVDGTRFLARAAVAVGARLIHISTDVVFDGERGTYTESDLPNPITDYGRSKALAEAAIREEIGAGIRSSAVIIRTSLIYGWQPRLDRQTRWVLESLQSGTPLHLFTDELRNPIWVDSLGAAVLELARMPNAEQLAPNSVWTLNIAGAQALSRYEFGTRLAKAYGVDPSPIIPSSSRNSGLHRPLDCTLDISRAQATLHTPLPGVDEVLTRYRS